MEENSIEEDIKIALDKFSDNKDIDSAILIVEKFILGNYILKGGRTNIVKDSLRYILSNYKKELKENVELKEEKDVDYTTVYLKGICDEREKWEKKVKDKLKETKARKEKDCIALHIFQREAEIDVLQELLKRENKI